MRTIEIMWTRGDRCTQPGGLILRQKDDGSYVTHRFNRPPHSRTPSEFFWGHYFHEPDAEARARADYAERRSHLTAEEISEGELIANGDANLQPGEQL